MNIEYTCLTLCILKAHADEVAGQHLSCRIRSSGVQEPSGRGAAALINGGLLPDLFSTFISHSCQRVFICTTDYQAVTVRSA